MTLRQKDDKGGPGKGWRERFHRVTNMLSTDLSTVLILAAAVVAVFCSGYAVLLAARARQYANDCAIYVQEGNKRSVSLAKIAKLEAELTELSDSYSELLKSFRKLRARTNMRERRAKDANGVESGDVPSDPDQRAAYKRQLRNSLKIKGLL